MGVGKPKGKGLAISRLGVKAYQTSSQKLIRLDAKLLIFEAEAMKVELDGTNTGNGSSDKRKISQKRIPVFARDMVSTEIAEYS